VKDSAAEQVDMQMKDRLACPRVRIDDGSITGAVDALFFRHSPGHGQQVAEKELIVLQIFVQRSNVLARYDKQMNGSLGIDVLKDKALLVFIQDLAGAFVSGYLAENTPEHTYRPFPIDMKKQPFDSREQHIWPVNGYALHMPLISGTGWKPGNSGSRLLASTDNKTHTKAPKAF
jgi:hypothetical protein